MLWVESVAYMGPDRRLRPSGLRLFERRSGGDLSEPLPLATAVRHLRARVGATHEANGLTAFCRRARAVSLLANAYMNRPVGDVLMGLVRQLEAPSRFSDDPGKMIYAALSHVETLLETAPVEH